MHYKMKNNFMESEHRYFQFPLCLLQKVLIDPFKGIDQIISYGIVQYSKSVRYDLAGVCRQLLYDFYKKEENLSRSLSKKMYSYAQEEVFSYDEDYKGFDGNGQFNPEENTNELLKIFEYDAEFKKEAIQHYRVQCATLFFGVSIGSMNYTLSSYEDVLKEIKSHEQKFGKQPQPGIKKDLLFEFRDKKSVKETELLCALVAIKSIIGQRNFAPTYKNVILMRMIGAKSKAALQEVLKQPKLREVYETYSKRYRMDKLIEKLVTRNFFRSKISFGRQIFFSTKLTMEELGDAIIEKRKGSKHKRLEKEIRKRIISAAI